MKGDLIMKKCLLTLALASAMVLSASAVFADTKVATHTCVKPTDNNEATLTKYESCMAGFIKAQKQGIANHEEAIKKAEAAMEQPQPAITD